VSGKKSVVEEGGGKPVDLASSNPSFLPPSFLSSSLCRCELTLLAPRLHDRLLSSLYLMMVRAFTKVIMEITLALSVLLNIVRPLNASQ